MKKRTLIGIILIAVILIGAIVIYINRDVVFTSKTIIRYPDGCVEQFDKDVLVTPECEKKNYTEEDIYNQYTTIPAINISFNNS